LRDDVIEVVSRIHALMPRGDGFPSLVETVKGRRYVMKMSGVGQGPAGLLTEIVAARVATALGLGVPATSVLHLGKDVPWEVGTDEFYDAMQRSHGANLGYAYVADARDLTVNDLADIAPAILGRLASVDALLQNVDRTAANPNLLRGGDGSLWAIDFGACLFLDRFARLGPRMSLGLPRQHLLAGRDPAPLDVDMLAGQLPSLLADIPDTWMNATFADRHELLNQLKEFLSAYRMAHDPSAVGAPDP